MSKKDLKVTLIGDDKTGKAFGSASSGAAKFSKLAIGAIAAVGAAAAGAGVALFKIGGEFDKSYDTIRVGTGATGKALDGLKDDFRDVVANVPTDFKSASTAIADLNTRTGQTGEPLRQLSKQMLEMTRLTGGDLSANIASVTRVFGDWGVAAKDQSGTMDYLFKVSQTTGIGIDALSQKVVQFGAPLRQMGFDFETSAAMLGKWEKEGVNTEAVLAGMKVGLGNMAAAGKEPVEAMREVSDAIKNAGSTGEATSIAMEVFGKRAGPDMAAAIREGRFDLDALMGTLKGSKETILGAAADTQDFGEKWQMFKNKVLLALEPIATRVFTAMGGYLDRFSAWWSANGPTVIATAAAIGATISASFSGAAAPIQAVTRFLQDHSATAKAVGAVVAAVAAAVAAAWAAQAAVATAQAARSVKAWITTAKASTTSSTIQSKSTAQIVVGWGIQAAKATLHAAKVVASWAATGVAAVAAGVKMAAQVAAMAVKWAFLGAQSLFHAAKVAAAWLIAMGPIGLVIAAVAGLVVVVVKNWDTIRAKTVELWNAVKGATSAAWAAIKGMFTAALGAIKAAFSAAWGAIRGAASAGMAAIRGAVSGGIGGVLSLVAGLPGRVRGALGNMGGLLVNAGRELMSGLARGIGEKIAAVVQKVRDAVSKIKNLLPGSPVKEGPLTSWNRGGAGKRLMGMLAGGIEDASDLPARAMARAVDFGDLAGMRVGGVGYVNSRLSSTAGAAPSGGSRSLTVNINAGSERIDADRLLTLLQRAERLAGYA
jgi:hypothetical protein